MLNYRKRQARDARLTFSAELEETIATELADAPDEFQARHEALRACMENLRGKDHDLLLHRYSQAGTLAEYAAKAGRSVGGLKVTLHRQRSILLTCIRRRLQSREASA